VVVVGFVFGVIQRIEGGTFEIRRTCQRGKVAQDTQQHKHKGESTTQENQCSASRSKNVY
jgi:hypothetical protein